MSTTQTPQTESKSGKQRPRMHGKVVFVTGGTRGIGGAISRSFGDQGAVVAAGYGRDAEHAGKFVSELAEQDITASVHQGNIGSAEDCRRTVSEVIDAHGRLDVLVNNAGITIDKTVLKMSDEDWYRVIAVNLSGAFFMSQAVLPHMIERGRGPDHQHLLDHRRDGQHRSGQLRRLQVRAVRAHQDARPRGGFAAGPRRQARARTRSG